MPSADHSETTPLLHYRLMSRSHSVQNVQQPPSPRQLRAFSGVFIPCVLSMFSVILFLRLGFVVGNAGLLGAVLMYLLAYFIVGMTVLAVCAISTNGAIEGGGAYFMISRALGPEFGGSIGIMFYFANVFSSALYLLGLTETVMDNFGPGGFMLPEGSSGLPSNRWWIFLYSSILLFLAFIVCMVGAQMFARTVLIIFMTVIVGLISVLLSFFIVDGPKNIPYAHGDHNPFDNATAVYFGLQKESFYDNFWSNSSRLDQQQAKMAAAMTSLPHLFSGLTPKHGIQCDSVEGISIEMYVQKFQVWLSHRTF
ncbi:solute carrier family 12 member 9-like [Saccoglossus kowalevskii]|uniref:Solute carrier family 12 member 9-like n=1 Tax=Saccoglossus kowalevskii TaxID=10224 RepID=A0ABM0GRM9_SACKO|nr:PREDICTED: solute carrier family 12 member 9-like [Saccoglossus kowalevskii]